MFSLLLALLVPAQSTAADPAFTVDQVIAKFTADFRASENCSFIDEDVENRAKNTEVFTVKSGKDPVNNYQIFQVLCSRGAYNFSYVVYKGSEFGGLELQSFAEPTLSAKGYVITGWTTTNYLVNANFEPKTMNLSFFSKGRGLGDCFTNGSYKFIDGNFVLKQYDADNECDGKIRARKIVNLK